ncbi:MAG: tRNA preQ1(34) S-adenosylmethionine ribosyltransferase-isomerase QueA [Candidatus Moraniibacteriota bacterium]|nr:MAG: tRNA preQ1(34) S-adenosylmethionine ribosyltransferase-isomerase QueA [Candidatus Moranbacteria bacterium]
MQLSDFHYDLPDELIAQSPAIPRDHSRLMLINRQTKEVSHHHFYDLPKLLPPNYHLIANNTKVFPARLKGFKETGGKVEVLLLKKLPESQFETIVSPGLKLGQKIVFSNNLDAVVVETDDRIRLIKFSQVDPLLTEEISTVGTMPTPPYIKKMLENNSDYQTIYAKYGFSAAAPTAGLHFTPELLASVSTKYGWSELTLDVGLGTFLPVKVEDVKSHHMHKEAYRLDQQTADRLKTIDHQNTKLCVVGTTTLRALESNLNLIPGESETEIFIYPPYHFRHADALITNFHLPESTLLMLVSAFCSSPQTSTKFTTFKDSLLGRAYQEAVKEKYRFFSFGDAMLII